MAFLAKFANNNTKRTSATGSDVSRTAVAKSPRSQDSIPTDLPSSPTGTDTSSALPMQCRTLRLSSAANMPSATSRGLPPSLRFSVHSAPQKSDIDPPTSTSTSLRKRGSFASLSFHTSNHSTRLRPPRIKELPRPRSDTSDNWFYFDWDHSDARNPKLKQNGSKTPNMNEHGIGGPYGDGGTRNGAARREVGRNTCNQSSKPLRDER
jgi:hypothetical protein